MTYSASFLVAIGTAAWLGMLTSISPCPLATNVAGLEVALDARVDVMAHALDDRDGFRDTHVERMKADGVKIPKKIKAMLDGKNKSFFFFSYEGFRNRKGATATSASVSPSCATLPKSTVARSRWTKARTWAGSWRGSS